MKDEEEDKSQLDNSASGTSTDLTADDNDAFMNYEQLDYDVHSAQQWNAVCTFFNCGRDVQRIRIPGLKMEPHNYQMYAIWWVLRQPTLGIAAAMLGDDTGLGKSGVALAVAVLHHQIQLAMREVEREWAGKGGDGPRKHLPPNAGEADEGNSICPNQERSQYGFQCPCVPTSLTRSVARIMAPSPCIFVAPANLLKPTWEKQLEQWIDFSEDSPSRDMRATFFHHQWLRQPNYHREEDVENTAVEPTVDGTGTKLVLQPSREKDSLASRYMIFVGSTTAYKLLDLYKTAGEVNNTQKNNTRKTNTQKRGAYRLAASFVFMDEIHNYAGSIRDIDTIPFKTVESLRQNAGPPVVPVGLSASFRTGGPRQWRAFFVHIFASNPHANRELLNLDTIEDLNHHEADFDFLVRRLNYADSHYDPAVKAAVESRRDKLLEFLRQTVPQILLARRKGKSFRGVPMGNAPREIIVEVLDMPAGRVRDAHKGLRSTVRTWIRARVEEAIKKWGDGGQVGPKPTFTAVEREVLEAASNSDLRSIKSYGIIIRAAVFPAIAWILEDETNNVNYKDILAGKVKTVANEVTTALEKRSQDANQVRIAVEQALKKSKFWKFRQELKESSPKYARLVQYIDHVISLNTTEWDESTGFPDPGPPPLDGSRARHILIYTDSQIASFLVFMLLYPDYHDRIEWVYIHSGISMERRTPMLERIEENLLPGAKNRIMITTFDLNATGLNLQRANYCIMMEIPKSMSAQSQAQGRIDRQGQASTAVVVQLVDDKNLSESLRRTRGGNRGKLGDSLAPDTSGLLDRIEDLEDDEAYDATHQDAESQENIENQEVAENQATIEIQDHDEDQAIVEDQEMTETQEVPGDEEMTEPSA